MIYKDIQLEIDGKEYFIAYKTKLSFVSEVHIFKATSKPHLIDGGYICSSKEVECKLIKASTIKDWLEYCLFNVRYKFRNKKR